MHAIERSLGYEFADPSLLDLALTHRSWVEERHPGGAAPAHLSQPWSFSATPSRNHPALATEYGPADGPR